MSFGLTPLTLTVRVRSGELGEVRSPLRNQELLVKDAVSFDARAELPSAMEQFLSAYGADVVAGLLRLLKARRIEVFSVEAAVSGELENAMVHLGVVGEEGSPRLRAASLTIYVSADGEIVLLENLVSLTLERSPIHQTLLRSVEIMVRVVVR
jgi:uncharacterized OsmC-like protein